MWHAPGKISKLTGGVSWQLADAEWPISRIGKAIIMMCASLYLIRLDFCPSDETSTMAAFTVQHTPEPACA